MSRQINQPINQVRLTNVAVVRMNRGGKRFEIACYRNKVVDYRQGLETDLSEVLQTERIFTNVSKGEFAKAKDLQKVFGTKDEEEIARIILSKGQVQISDKERSQQLEKTNAQIAEWISKNCVQPNTDRPYTISQIRYAMQQANFSVHPTKPLKRQYLDCVKLLQHVIPIQRAKMELSLQIPDKEESTRLVEDLMKEHEVEWSIGDAKDANNRNYKMIVDPSFYRVLNEAVVDIPTAHIEIVTQVVTKQGDAHLETDLENPPDVVETELQVVEPPEDITPAMNDLSVAADTENIAETDGSDEDDLEVNQRRQQKLNKKKNRKNQRREGSNSNSTPSSTEIAPLGGSLSTNNVDPPSEQSAPQHESDGGESSPRRKSCNTCGGAFDTPAGFRAHFKSDWHRFNQKLKLKGATPISEEEFKLCDSDTFFGGISGDDIL